MVVASVLLLVLLVLSLIWLGRFVWLRRRLYALARNIPGPTGIPLLGNIISFTGSAEKTFNRFLEWYELYGPVLKAWIGPKLYVGILDPADAQIVLGNQKIRNRDYSISLAMMPFFGLGLLSNRDATWRMHRKLITPAFHFKILESYVPIFQSKANILADKLHDTADGRTIDLHHQISLCMLDAICQTAIGINMNIQQNEISEFGTAVMDSMDLVHNRVLRPWLLLEWLYPMTADGKKAKKVINHMKAFSEDVIATKLAEYRNGTVTSSVTSGSDKQVRSFLDTLIEASEKEGRVLSPEEIRDEVTTMAAAGMETTTTTLSYALVLLGMNPECQDRIAQEMDEIFGKSDRSATADDVHKMCYVEYCIKETLRLFPAVMVMPREITEDLEITRGYVLPAGCSAVVMSYIMHRNARYYQDPERYWPDRWSAENSVGRHPYAYLPFSAGSRNCIGHKYATLKLKTVLSTIMRRYRVKCNTTMEDLKRIEISVAIRSANGYKIQLYEK